MHEKTDSHLVFEFFSQGHDSLTFSWQEQA